MKPAILIGAAFAVGLGGASFVGMRQAPAAPAASAAKGAPTPKTVATTAPAVTDSAAGPHERATVAVDSPAVAHPDTIIAPAAVPAAAVPAADGAKRLAGVLAKLPAADIVPLVEHISDDDLVPVLRQLDVSTTASVLALLPATRAKALSKRLLVTPVAAKP